MRKLHKDNLTEQHFVELRQFLHKKHRQEAIAAKVNSKSTRGGSLRITKPNDDFGSQGIDREILADIMPGSNASPSTTNRPVMSKAG